MRVFATQGYRAASVTDIVESAEVARGTLYHYFNSKKDIFLHLIDFYFDRLSRLLESNSLRLKEAVMTGDPPLYAWLVRLTFSRSFSSMA